MKPLRTHTPAKHRNGAKVAALVAAALLTVSSAGSAELTQEARDLDNAVLVALGTQPKSAGAAAVGGEEEWQWKGDDSVELLCCNGDRNVRSQVLAKKNLNEAIAIAVEPVEGGDGGGLYGTFTPLTAAAAFGNARDVKTLLARGANINARDPDGYTPLMRAANEGKPDNIKLLLANAADANATSAWGDTAVSLAGSDDDAVRALQAAGAKKNPIAEGASDAFGNTALILAAKQGDIKEMQRLIAAGADVNAANQAGNTALLVAVKGYERDAAKLLLKRGANVNAANGKGETVLMYAAESGDTPGAEFVKLLLSKGANVHAKDKDGSTALDHAYATGELGGDAEASHGKVIAALKSAAKISSGKRK